jgi:lipopolysaccharide/colanic/teichoic acid biosynthesis glycosyltransferase
MQNESQASDGRLISATAGKSGLGEFDVLERGQPYGQTSARPARSRPDRSRPASFFRYRVLKRAADILLILLALPVLLPAIFLVGMLVRLTSPGPVFFSHRRICRDGAFFSMWKFRTMCVDSSDVLERHLAQHHKLRVDPRITSVGLFLRRFSLDELPQIWNVLRGQMSLVGPRPIVAAEVEKYADCFDHYCRVKPGVTGLWQVSGRSELTYPQRVALDCEYVERWSMWRDFKILLVTCKSVVNRDGAY